jgi:hypothetical protein
MLKLKSFTKSLTVLWKQNGDNGIRHSIAEPKKKSPDSLTHPSLRQ